MSKSTSEICHLCGATGPLTAEHVPPRRAFNNGRVVYAEHVMDEWLQTGARWTGKGRVQQGGSRKPTLCASCNNNTGAWYGAEYVNWAKGAARVVSQVPPGGYADLTVVGAYPLRFLKQALTMFFSINDASFRDHHLRLADFVLEREKRGLPDGYEVYLALVSGQHARSVAVSGVLNVETGTMHVLSEVAHPPLALVMTFGSATRSPVGRITHFGDNGYDEKCDVDLSVLVGSIYSPYPGDYRAEQDLPSRREGPSGSG